MITTHPAALAYARQTGVALDIGTNISTDGTVGELYTRAKDAGLKVTTKMRKDQLLSIIGVHNKKNEVCVDTDRLTVAQRRRLRRKYGIAA